MTEELKELWIPGITFGDITYRIALVNGIWDGRGFEQITKTQGAGSLVECNACTFPGVTYAQSICSPYYSRYLEPDDSRRLKRPLNVPNRNVMYNLTGEVAIPPVERTYQSYVTNASKEEADESISHSEGV